MPRRIRIDALEIEEPEVLRETVRALRNVLNDPSIDYRGEALARQRLRFVFPSRNAQASAAVGNRLYPVAPFLEVEGRVYWVGAEIELRPERGEYEFHSVSLVLFLRRGQQEEMEAVLRAEWEQISERPVPNGQPHWHVYLTTAEQAQHVRYILMDDLGFHELDEAHPIPPEQVASEEQQALRRFHFAMAARWHSAGVELHYEEPDPQKISAWIQGCLNYTRAQLQQQVTRGLPPHRSL